MTKAKTKQRGRMSLFFGGIRATLKQISWPSKSDLWTSTGVVFAILLFISIYMFFFGQVYLNILRISSSTGGQNLTDTRSLIVFISLTVLGIFPFFIPMLVKFYSNYEK
jgi:preprotein translocase SecE subunit